MNTKFIFFSNKNQYKNIVSIMKFSLRFFGDIEIGKKKIIKA